MTDGTRCDRSRLVPLSPRHVPLATVEAFAKTIAEAYPPPPAPPIAKFAAPVAEACPPPAPVTVAAKATNTVQAGVQDVPTVPTDTDKPFADASETTNMKYNPKIIEEFAEGLYQRATSVAMWSIVRYVVGLGIFGFVAGFVIARFEGGALGSFLGAIVAGMMGWVAGEAQASCACQATSNHQSPDGRFVC